MLCILFIKFQKLCKTISFLNSSALTSEPYFSIVHLRDQQIILVLHQTFALAKAADGCAARGQPPSTRQFHQHVHQRRDQRKGSSAHQQELKRHSLVTGRECSSRCLKVRNSNKQFVLKDLELMIDIWMSYFRPPKVRFWKPLDI